LRFFAGETVEHFREEEELLFPLVVDFDEARELLVQALLEHQRLHALTSRLQQLVTTGGEIDDVMRELGEVLEAHVRLEERRLFPMIDRLLEDVPELQPRLRDELEAAASDQSRRSVGVRRAQRHPALLEGRCRPAGARQRGA
jgi:hemerythrin-like domain-containing protein